MDKNALSVKAPKSKSSVSKTALLIARIAVVFDLVSLFITVLNPLRVVASIEDYTLRQVFGDFTEYSKGLADSITNFYVSTTLTVAAYIMLAAMIVLAAAFVVSFFDGTPKKVAVTAMAIGFCAVAVSCFLAGIFSFTGLVGDFGIQNPYSILAGVIFTAAMICCIVSLKHKSGAVMYGKNVDPNTIGGKLTGYFAGAAAEVKKIVWPDRSTVIKNTGVVLLFILAIGVVIWLLDFAWGELFTLIFTSKG